MIEMEPEIPLPSTNPEPRKRNLGLEITEVIVIYIVATILGGISVTEANPNSGCAFLCLLAALSGVLMFRPCIFTRIICFCVLLLSLLGLWDSKISAENRAIFYRKQFMQENIKAHPKQ